MNKPYHTKPPQSAHFTPTEAAYKKLEESFDKARRQAVSDKKTSPLDVVEVTHRK